MTWTLGFGTEGSFYVPLCPSLPLHLSTHHQPHPDAKCKSLPGFLAMPLAQDGVGVVEVTSQSGDHSE